MTPFSITKTKNNLVTKYTNHNAITNNGKNKTPYVMEKEGKKIAYDQL